MENKCEDEILMEIAIGKSVARKLPSYMKDTRKDACKKTVAEQVLFG